MSIRGLAIFLYCTLLALGTLWIIQRNGLEPIDFVATRDLPIGHLLVPGDLVPAQWDDTLADKLPMIEKLALADRLGLGKPKPGDFLGRYVGGDVPKGALVTLEATGYVPLLAPRPGIVLLLATLPRGVSQDINAGSCVRLKLKDAKPFPVRTILCPATAQADCAAVIDVALGRLPAIDTAPVTVDAGVPCS